MSKKIIFYILLFIGFSSSLFAEGNKTDYTRPRNNEIILVARVVMSPDVNESFYTQYWNLDSHAIHNRNELEPGEIIRSTTSMNIYKNQWANQYLSMGPEGSISSITMDIPKDRIIKLNSLTFYPSNLGLFAVYLPLHRQITVSENQHYIYLGTFVYHWNGYQFDITNVEKIDEYDKAKQAVIERYGEDVQLIRVPLQEWQE